MKIAIAQINTIVGDLEGNYNKITEYINKAKKAKCDIVVFPELAISGYPPEDLLLRQNFITDQLEFVKKLKTETKDIAVVLGYVHPYENNLYNACTVFYNGYELARHSKQHLPNYSVFDEKRYFTSGDTIQTSIFNYKDQKIAVNICEDIWMGCGVCDEQGKAEPDIMINISCSPYYSQKIKERESLLIKRATEYKTNIVYCNLVGGQDELVFDGGSMIVNKTGILVARSYQFIEDLLVYEFLNHDKNMSEFEKVEIDTVVNHLINPMPCTYEKNEEIYRALKLGLGDYIRKNGFKQVVLGMSGGIDSALVAKLAVDTIGAENVICISMPSQYSSKETQSDAEKYSKFLEVYFNTFPIQNLFEGYVNYLDPYFGGHGKGVTEENIQARIRGNIIMAFSNNFGYMPLSTGNKSEVSVGYCTLYGDMSGGFNPIKDLYKTQVYELAKYVGVPESIINRPPSAELKEDQKDEDSLPPYDVLDLILVKLMEKNEAPKGELEIKIAKLLRLSEYKRRQSCPGIKITKRSYGKDYRMPIVNGYHE